MKQFYKRLAYWNCGSLVKFENTRIWLRYLELNCFSSRGSAFWCACVVNWRDPQRREVSEKSIKRFREVWTHWNYEGKEERGQSRWKVAVKFMPGDTLIPENLGGKCTWQGSASTRGEVLSGDPPPLRSCLLPGRLYGPPSIQFFARNLSRPLYLKQIVHYSYYTDMLSLTMQIFHWEPLNGTGILIWNVDRYRDTDIYI